MAQESWKALIFSQFFKKCIRLSEWKQYSHVLDGFTVSLKSHSLHGTILWIKRYWKVCILVSVTVMKGILNIDFQKDVSVFFRGVNTFCHWHIVLRIPDWSVGSDTGVSRFKCEGGYDAAMSRCQYVSLHFDFAMARFQCSSVYFNAAMSSLMHHIRLDVTSAREIHVVVF